MARRFVYIICILIIALVISAAAINIAFADVQEKSSDNPAKMIAEKENPAKGHFSASAGTFADDFETDDYSDLAWYVSTDNIAQEHSFHLTTDIDWLAFNGTENKTYIIQTKAVSSTVDTYLRLYDTDAETLISYNDDINTSTNNSRITWFCAENGTYFIKVTPSSAVNGWYNISVNNTTTAPPVNEKDNYEIDNAYYLAAAIPTNRTYQNHSFQYFTNDEDYVNITNVSANQIYVIETYNATTGADTYLKLYNDDGTLSSYITYGQDVAFYDDIYYPYNNNSRIVFKPTASGFYYADVLDKWTKGGNYNVSVYNVTTSKIYTNGTNVTKTFNRTGSAEFFNFTALNGTTYTIRTYNTTTNADTYIYLYDENMSLLRRNNNDYNETNYKNSLLSWYASAGYNNTTMYVMVSDSKWNGGSFNIAITNSTPAGDSYEHDGDSSLAAWIFTNGTTQNHSFSPIGEEDWMQFNGTNGSTYVIETQNTTKYTDTFIKLYYSNKTQISYNDDISSTNYGSRLVLNCTETGNYSIQIVDLYDYGGNYTVSINQNGTVSAEITNIESEQNVTQYGTFEVIVNITCDSGVCGNITATLDPEKEEPRSEDSVADSGIIIEKSNFNPLFSSSSESNTYLVLLKTKSGSGFSAASEDGKDIIRETQNNFLTSMPDVKVNRAYKTMAVLSLELTPEQLAEISARSDIIEIEKQRNFTMSLDDSVPQINGPNASRLLDNKALNVTGYGQTVCILDTGANYSHPALAHAYAGGYNIYWGNSTPMDDNGHGTHVAGIIVSNNTTYRGVAPDAKFVAVKVLGSSGSGSSSDILAGIDWCIDNAALYNISVISMSIGTDDEWWNDTSECEADNPVFTYAIDLATEQGISVVVASGNEDNSTGISAPACIDNAISVGSVTKSDVVSSFSNAASILDLLAPGEDITSTSLRGGSTCSTGSNFASCSGTSMATPHVAGAILLLNQYAKSKTGSNLAPEDALDYLNKTGFQINDTRNGYNFSRIDVYAALGEILTDAQKGIIPMTSGIPFFTTSQNPRYPANLSCLKNMVSGSYCEVTWIVNATGQNDSTPWEFFIDVNSTLYGTISATTSDKVNITITSQNIAPHIDITSPDADAQLNASNFWINATLYSNTSLVSGAQFRIENSTWNSTWTTLNRTNATNNWYYLFNSSALAEGDYAIRISANNSLKTNNQTTINITLDNKYPRITITTLTLPQNTQTPWLNYTITDISKNTTWYVLNNGDDVITNDTGESPINVTLDLLYPGLQNLTVYANDSFSNTNSTSKAFYEFFLMNMSNWTTELPNFDPEITGIIVTNSTGGDITNNDSVNISATTMNITLQTTNFNITLLNFTGQNATWAANPTFNVSETNTALETLFGTYGSNVSSLISVYNMSLFLATSSLYNAMITFEGNNSSFSDLYYCNDSITSVSNCTKLTPTCVSGTNCYSSSASATNVYLAGLSSLVIANDTVAPTITFNSPENKTYSSNSESYNISINVTASSDAVSCTRSINGTLNVSMTKVSGHNYFVNFPILDNGVYNVTVYCTDGRNLNSSTIYFVINDSTKPGISTSATEVDDNSATITTTSDEKVYGVLFYAKSSTPVESHVDSSDCQSWKDSDSDWDNWVNDSCTSSNGCSFKILAKSGIKLNPSFALSSLSSDTRYYYGACLCDFNGNCQLENADLSFITNESSNNSNNDRTGGTGGSEGNGSSAPTKITGYWSNVAANTPTSWIISSAKIPISNITFKLSEAVKDVTMELTSLGTDYSTTLLPAAPNNGYAYFKLTTTAYGKISTADITFKIPQSWFTANNFDKSKVRLYHGAGSQWESLYTEVVETEGTEYTFKATTPGFSFFAITAPNAPPVITPNATLNETYASQGNTTTITTDIVNLSCGNKICSASETCLTCPADCGNCTLKGTNFFTNMGGFISLYWIPMLIGGVIIGAAAVFFVITTKEGLLEFLIPKGKTPPPPSRSSSGPKTTKSFELSAQKKTKQETLTQEKPKPPETKSFSIFSKDNKKKSVIEELKKQPGVFKLR